MVKYPVQTHLFEVEELGSGNIYLMIPTVPLNVSLVPFNSMEIT